MYIFDGIKLMPMTDIILFSMRCVDHIFQYFDMLKCWQRVDISIMIALDIKYFRIVLCTDSQHLLYDGCVFWLPSGEESYIEFIYQISVYDESFSRITM